MSDRIFGLITAVAALAFFAGAARLERAFFSDPVGPSLFPYLISGAAFLAACTIILRPDAEPDWPGLATLARIAVAVVVLVLYALALKPFGFLASTAVAAGLLAYQISPRAVPAVLTGVGLSAGLFLIFKFLLGLSLAGFPKGMAGFLSAGPNLISAGILG